MARERPLFVGFSTITGPQLRPSIEASRRVHALGVPVVWGGVHATIMPREVLEEPYVDFVVVNEGEVTSQELALRLAGDLDPEWSAVSGLAYTGGHGRPVMTPERPFLADLDVFRPRWELLPDLEIYLIQSGPYDRPCPSTSRVGAPSAAASATTRSS